MGETMEKLARYEAAVQHDAVSKRREACSLYLRAASLQCIEGHFDEARQILDRVIERWEREDETSYMLTLYARLNQLQGKLQMQQQDWERAQSSFQVAYIYIGGKRPYMRRAFGTGDTNYWRSQKDWAYCLRIQGKYKDAIRIYSRICTGSKLDSTPRSVIRMHWAYLMEAICSMHTQGLKKPVADIATSLCRYLAMSVGCGLLGVLLFVGGPLAIGRMSPESVEVYYPLSAFTILFHLPLIFSLSWKIEMGRKTLAITGTSSLYIAASIIGALLFSGIADEGVFWIVILMLGFACSFAMGFGACFSLVLRARRIRQIKKRVQS